MTPLQIEIALHYHISQFDYRNRCFDPPIVASRMPLAVRHTIEMFLCGGFLVANPMAGKNINGFIEPAYRATDSLRAYVERLCEIRPVPFPGEQQSRVIADKLLRKIDKAMRQAETRLQKRAEFHGETDEDVRVIDQLSRALFELEHQSQASLMKDLIEVPIPGISVELPDGCNEANIYVNDKHIGSVVRGEGFKPKEDV